MHIPTQNLGGFAADLIAACTASLPDRIERGKTYKNLYLTGDGKGDPAVYPKTFSYIEELSSYLYSPVDLAWKISPRGMASRLDLAKCRAATSEMSDYIRGDSEESLDTLLEEAVTWALVKGKTYIKLLWGGGELRPYLLQPESMGVLQENLTSLDKQEAFVHMTFITTDDFRRLVTGHPREKELLRRVAKYIKSNSAGENPETNQYLREVVLGGLAPFQIAGQGSNTKNKGIVNWMQGPEPQMDPQVLAKIIRLDELWIKDSSRHDEWTTIQIVGDDCVIEGEEIRRNVFADAIGVSPEQNDSNPLKNKHPFNEICPNRLDGYHWGRSEICNVGLLQETLNVTVNGINWLLRLQEKPPMKFSGVTSTVNQTVVSRLNKPGGYFSDSSPNAKVEQMAPQIPQGLWERKHETEMMFDVMGGMKPVIQGRGEGGVRSQGHAETLVRMASPRFKDRALAIERQVESVAGLSLDILRAHVKDKLVAWVPEKDSGLEGKLPDQLEGIDEPPFPGAKRIEFTFHSLPTRIRVKVDSHSASPAFSHESEQKVLALAKLGALDAEQVVERLHPGDEDQVIASLEAKKAAEAELVKQHPELLLHQGGKKKK